MSEYHVPVLLDQSVDGLLLHPGGVYVDVTFGGGGHSREIIRRLEGGNLIAFDQDIDAEANRIDDPRFVFVRHNFRYIRNFLKYHEFDQVDGILADLGVSSHEFDVAERGFSFRFDGRLDMRMNQDAKKDAVVVLNEYSEKDLADMFRMYGEIKNFRRLASIIVEARQQQQINDIAQFKEVIAPCTPKGLENKYLAKVFQAIRIEVNDEMGALKEFLTRTTELIKPGGRLVVITYHSLEDRMVKNFMKAGNIAGKVEKDFYGKANTPWEVVTRKIILPTDEEIERNPRARSAKLRIAKRV